MPFRSRLLLLTNAFLFLVVSIALQAQTFTLGVSIGLVPTSATLSEGQSKQFNISLMGTNNTDVFWSVNPALGSVTNGLYTAPVVISAPTLVTVTVISVADSSVSASAAVSLVPGGGSQSGSGVVSVSPAFASLVAGQSLGFSSNVTAKWTLTPQIGVFVNGIYTAPTSISTQQTVALKATSAADATKFATAYVTLIPNSSPAPAPSVAAPPAGVSLFLSPSTASVNAGQSVQFVASVSNTNNPGVAWSIAPPLGTLTNGVYTAPVTIGAAQNVVVTATSLADTSKSASATISLTPNVATPPIGAANSASLSPAFISVSPGQNQKFTFTINGVPDSNVLWNTIPMIGSIDQGMYTAPVIVGSQTTVTVIATSISDPSKSASAALMVVPVFAISTPPSAPTPTIGITVSPNAVSLGAGKLSQFTASVSGTANTAVNWSITPAFGSINNGLYTAPATISATQTVTVSATSAADPSKVAQANIVLTPTAASSVGVTPAQVTLAVSQSQQFFASVSSSGTLGGGGFPTITWSVIPQVGSISQTGMYTAPASLSSTQSVLVTASALGQTSSATVLIQVPGSSPAPSTPTPPAPPSTPGAAIQLPVEVMGPDGTATSVSVNVSSSANLSGQQKLWLQVHGIRYQSQASVQINGGSWIAINDSTATLQGLAGAYGGIGGGFSTIKLTLNVPGGALHSGANTLAFRFNGTDGNSSGFRVLSLNLLGSDGSQLLPQSSFTWDDPSGWQAPLNNSSDIQAGRTLWNSANLSTPGVGSIQAKCASCHAQDGRDLKYFNYSNNSIRVRSMFHGLSAQQGDQIASYIRTLNVPSPSGARPWNPPYQPGPGLDSRPVSEWAAGAGIDAVLDSDAAMQPYLMPGGSTSGWAANGYVNPREIPIALQLPDWNSWLPKIHPLDAYGASFLVSRFNTVYSTLRGMLQPNNPTAYQKALEYLTLWNVSTNQNFLVPLESGPMASGWSATQRNSVYSAAQWSMVKLWELNQEFGLEGMPQVAFGAKANLRGWVGNQPFFTSPNMLHMTPGPGLGNGLPISHTYLSYIWYHLQMILNDGQGAQVEHSPIDYGYVYGFTKDLNWNSNVNTPEAMLHVFWHIKALQEMTLTGTGPQAGGYGFLPSSTAPYDFVDSAWSGIWSATSPSNRANIMQAYLQTWFAQASIYTPQQYYQGGWASPTVNPATLDRLTTFGGELWNLLPWFRYYGVDANLTRQVGNWGATIWPLGNWAFNNSSTCGVSKCTIDAP